MLVYLTTIGLILILLLGWIVVQRTYRLFAHEHPELGPFRGEGHQGCGSCSGECGGDSCDASSGR
jgi:hypothetical protein